MSKIKIFFTIYYLILTVTIILAYTRLTIADETTDASGDSVSAPAETTNSNLTDSIGSPSFNIGLQPSVVGGSSAGTCGPRGNEYVFCVPIFGEASVPNSLKAYIALLYRFALGIGGLLVFIMVVWGGIEYTISAGNTALVSDAKNRIFQAIYGLLLLSLSYIILNTINPSLVSLKEPGSGNLPTIAPPALFDTTQLDHYQAISDQNNYNQTVSDLEYANQNEQNLNSQLDKATSDEEKVAIQQQLEEIKARQTRDQQSLEAYKQRSTLNNEIQNAKTPQEREYYRQKAIENNNKIGYFF